MRHGDADAEHTMRKLVRQVPQLYGRMIVLRLEMLPPRTPTKSANPASMLGLPARENPGRSKEVNILSGESSITRLRRKRKLQCPGDWQQHREINLAC